MPTCLLIHIKHIIYEDVYNYEKMFNVNVLVYLRIYTSDKALLSQNLLIHKIFNIDAFWY